MPCSPHDRVLWWMPKLATSKEEAPDRLLPSQSALLERQMVNQTPSYYYSCLVPSGNWMGLGFLRFLGTKKSRYQTRLHPPHLTLLKWHFFTGNARNPLCFCFILLTPGRNKWASLISAIVTFVGKPDPWWCLLTVALTEDWLCTKQSHRKPDCQAPISVLPLSLYIINRSLSLCLIAKSCPTLLRPHRPQLARLLCLWDSPSKNTGVGYHFLLQWIFLTQVLYVHLLLWKTDSLPLSYQGSPIGVMWY